MSLAPGWRRSLAHQLFTVSAWLLPASLSSWARAMHAEVHLIDDDKEALRWAIGAVGAGCNERLRAWRLHRLWSARSAAIVWILVFITGSVFNVCIALAARLGWQHAATAMGWWLRGFQYENFLPLAQAMPVELFVLMGMVVLGFCLSLALSLLRHRGAFSAFCCALCLSLLAWLYQLGIPAYLTAISAPHRWRSGLCFLLTIGVLSVLGNASEGQSSATVRTT